MLASPKRSHCNIHNSQTKTTYSNGHAKTIYQVYNIVIFKIKLAYCQTTDFWTSSEPPKWHLSNSNHGPIFCWWLTWLHKPSVTRLNPSSLDVNNSQPGIMASIFVDHMVKLPLLLSMTTSPLYTLRIFITSVLLFWLLSLNFSSCISNMGVSLNGGTTNMMVYNGKIPFKWMMTGGTPILGKPHMIHFFFKTSSCQAYTSQMNLVNISTASGHLRMF